MEATINTQYLLNLTAQRAALAQGSILRSTLANQMSRLPLLCVFGDRQTANKERGKNAFYCAEDSCLSSRFKQCLFVACCTSELQWLLLLLGPFYSKQLLTAEK